MRIIPCAVLIVHLVAGVAYAQTFNDLQIQLGGFNEKPNGGEKPVGVWWSTGPVVIGRAGTSTFSLGKTCEAFAVSSGGSLIDNATFAWRIEVTPTRVVRDAVTFRLRWRLATLRQEPGRLSLGFDDNFPSPTEETELTLRPGESSPVYTVKVQAGTKNVYGRPCGDSASIRVSVDNYPSEELDRRLVAADLWLIERLSNGTEAQRSQISSVRGLPNRPIRFYFDSIVDGQVSLDIYGILIARLASGEVAVSVETRSRWGDSGPERSVESVINVKPEEIVEIPLPRLGDRAGPFGNRQFSIRIRARQLR